MLPKMENPGMMEYILYIVNFAIASECFSRNMKNEYDVIKQN